MNESGPPVFVPGEPGSLRARLRGELRCERPLVLGVVAATLAGSAAMACGPWLIRRAIDGGMVAGDRSTLSSSILAYVGVLVFGGVAAGVRTVLAVTASERFIHRLRTDALAGVLRLPTAAYDRARRGDLLSRVTADTEALSDAARWMVPDAVRYLVDLVTAVTAVALLDLRLAGAALLAVPPMLLAGRALRDRSRLVYPRYRSELAALLGYVTETVEAAPTVRAHGRQRARLAGLHRANLAVTDAMLAGTSMRNRFYASLTVTRVATTALVLVVAALLGSNGTITVGTAAAGALAVSAVFGPLAWLTELADDLLSARAALERVVAASTLPATPTGAAELPASGDVVFDGVAFAYLPGHPVLEDVDLVIPSGARAAVVGATGAGKTTLGRLVAGLAAPSAGSVRIGGVTIDELSHAARRRLVFVTQEPWCANGTLADNLLLAAPEADRHRLQAAIDALGLGGWVAGHPDGLDRAVGPGGERLSTGERQLVALLRLALVDPAVVVLDEATAVLDPTTEALVGAAVDRVLAGRTVVVIAHRPATAARSDQRILVAHGTIFSHPIKG